MKKIVTIVSALLLCVLFSTTVSANNPLTENEKQIIQELKSIKGADGKEYFTPTDRVTQAENTFKTNTYTDAQTKEVLDLITSSKELITQNSKGIVGTDLEDFGRQLPKNVKDQLRDNFTKAANILGLKVDPKTFSLLDSNGKGIASTKAPIVKATGANYTPSFLIVGSLFVGALGMAVIGKKYWMA